MKKQKKPKRRGLLRALDSSGNVVNIGKPKPYNPLDYLSYDELLAERRYCRAQIKVVEKMNKLSAQLDPRGAVTPELGIIEKRLCEYKKSMERFTQFAEEQMINLTKVKAK